MKRREPTAAKPRKASKQPAPLKRLDAGEKPRGPRRLQATIAFERLEANPRPDGNVDLLFFDRDGRRSATIIVSPGDAARLVSSRDAALQDKSTEPEPAAAFAIGAGAWALARSARTSRLYVCDLYQGVYPDDPDDGRMAHFEGLDRAALWAELRAMVDAAQERPLTVGELADHHALSSMLVNELEAVLDPFFGLLWDALESGSLDQWKAARALWGILGSPDRRYVYERLDRTHPLGDVEKAI